jgi:type II secretory pathway pseudopilin PulG
MKLSRSDLSLMQWSLLAISAAALLSAAFLYVSGQYATQTQQDRRSAQTRLDDARRQLKSAQEDKQNMATYAEKYLALANNGIIGDGQRLDWMEGLEKLRQQQLVSSFRYNIAPQKTHTPMLPIDSGNFDIQYSEMTMEFDLLHEGQLLNFFAALRNQVKGHYQLEGCTLKRRNGNEESGGMTGLTAACRGGWITLKNRNATP